MSRYIVLMRCVGFVDVQEADTAEEAMRFAEECEPDQIRNVSEFYPEAAIAANDLPGLQKFVKLVNRMHKGRVGRPRVTISAIPEPFMKCYKELQNKRMTVSDIARACKLSRPTVYKYISMIESAAAGSETDENQDG